MGNLFPTLQRCSTNHTWRPDNIPITSQYKEISVKTNPKEVFQSGMPQNVLYCQICHVTNDMYITLVCLFFVYCSASKLIWISRLVTRGESGRVNGITLSYVKMTVCGNWWFFYLCSDEEEVMVVLSSPEVVQVPPPPLWRRCKVGKWHPTRE